MTIFKYTAWATWINSTFEFKEQTKLARLVSAIYLKQWWLALNWNPLLSSKLVLSKKNTLSSRFKRSERGFQFAFWEYQRLPIAIMACNSKLIQSKWTVRRRLICCKGRLDEQRLGTGWLAAKARFTPTLPGAQEWKSRRTLGLCLRRTWTSEERAGLVRRNVHLHIQHIYTHCLISLSIFWIYWIYWLPADQ